MLQIANGVDQPMEGTLDQAACLAELGKRLLVGPLPRSVTGINHRGCAAVSRR
jgi:hypothetical protein